MVEALWELLLNATNPSHLIWLGDTVRSLPGLTCWLTEDVNEAKKIATVRWYFDGGKLEDWAHADDPSRFLLAMDVHRALATIANVYDSGGVAPPKSISALDLLRSWKRVDSRPEVLAALDDALAVMRASGPEDGVPVRDYAIERTINHARMANEGKPTPAQQAQQERKALAAKRNA